MDEQKITDMYNKGIEAYRRGDITHAIDLLTRVVETNEAEHKAWNALGVAFAKAGKYMDADICFGNAVMLDPDIEIYTRNRNKNADHLPKDTKKKLEDIIKLLREYYAGKTSKYVIGGVISVIVLFLIISFIILPILKPSPMAVTAGEIPINIKLEGDQVVITYTGSIFPQLSVFNITADNQSVTSPNGEIKKLGIDPGSFLSIPLDELRPFSTDNTTTIRSYAIFTDGSTRKVLTKTITIPPLQIETTPISTPTPAPYAPLYKPGDLLISKDDGSYLLIIGFLPHEKYEIIPLSRRYDGLFQVINGSPLTTGMQGIDNSTSDSGLVLQDTNYLPDSLHKAMHKQNISVAQVVPIYSAGDLIALNQNARQDAVIILGYDVGTDEYATDTLYKYYNGEWGYRKSAITTWKPRSEIEGLYPARINHIPLHSVGIGEDSSPSGSPVLFNIGDILAKDTGADAKQVIILSYNAGTNKYEIDTIKQSTEGRWYRSGNSTIITRSVLEREFPYKTRTVDLDLVKI